MNKTKTKNSISIIKNMINHSNLILMRACIRLILLLSLILLNAMTIVKGTTNTHHVIASARQATHMILIDMQYTNKKWQDRLVKDLKMLHDLGIVKSPVHDQIRHCGLLAYLSILYQADMVLFNQIFRLLEIGEIDYLMIGLVNTGMISQFQFNPLPSINLFDLLLEKGLYTFMDRKTYDKLIKLYIGEILKLLLFCSDLVLSAGDTGGSSRNQDGTLLYGRPDPPVEEQIYTRATVLVHENIKIAKDHIITAFHDNLDDKDRLFTLGQLYPGGMAALQFDAQR